MVSKKKSKILGTVVGVVLIVSMIYVYLFATTSSLQVALFSEQEAEKISGQSYTQSYTTILQGSNLSNGVVMDKTVRYSNQSGSFFDQILVFNNHTSSQLYYTYIASHLNVPGNLLLTFAKPMKNYPQISPYVENANLTRNGTYRGFNYTYLVQPILITFQGKYYIWDTCGISENMLFYVWGDSPSLPHDNMSTVAKDQINLIR